MNTQAPVVLVTGSGGFLGRHVCDALDRANAYQVVRVDGRRVCDLRNPAATQDLLASVSPDYVIHLAAVVGGIGANMASPATFWHDNLAMGMNILRSSREIGRKLIVVGTTCGYPERPLTIPFVEEEFFDGYPEPTNAPYGIAKRCLFCGAKAYGQQYGLKMSLLIPTNLYGPGDNYDPEKSHVIPALFRKMVEARNSGRDSVTLWGTGKATRDFLYAPDAAAAIVRSIEVDTGMEWINLGSGREVSIVQVAALVAEVVGFKGQIVWDSSKPDGQPRRVLDTEKAKRILGWEAMTSLRDGLWRTYESLVNQ